MSVLNQIRQSKKHPSLHYTYDYIPYILEGAQPDGMMVKEVVSYLGNEVMNVDKTVRNISISQQADRSISIDRKSEMNSLDVDQDYK